jgi:hypothetical protein
MHAELMAKVFRVLAVIATTLVSFFLLGLAYTFGRCEGWKGTGTCPRVPLWDWEIFWIAFWAGVFPAAALRLRTDHVLRGTVEALGAGIIAGSLVVGITGF